MVVLEAAGLSKHFRAGRGSSAATAAVRAVDGISFAIEGGRTLGVVGESGCGKTTTAKLVLGLEEPTGGSIRFEGRDLNELDAQGVGTTASRSRPCSRTPTPRSTRACA